MSEGDIFIVDDSADNLAVLSGMLRGAGYGVRMANGGRRALEAMAARPPELVLLDINMPDMDGYAVCQALKASPASRDIPVIFLSALDDARDKVSAFRAGGVDYVTKPFAAEEVLARVANHLSLARLRKALEEKTRTLETQNRELTEAWGNADRLFAALSVVLPGTLVDNRYRLLGKIGAGGSAAVYRATDEQSGRVVAVKILRPQSGPDAEGWRDRFLHEWGASSVISHPNAVAMLDAGTTSAGLPYLVMELLEGRTMADELGRAHVLTVRRTAEILAPVCRMLEAAHDAHLVHRDIKPANIFLHGPDGRGEVVKVVDFGIAKLVDSQSPSGLTTQGRLVGTPIYMSAERLMGRACDGRADVYAVAVTAYEALTGRPPFVSAEGTVTATIFACLGAPLEPPSRHRGDVPPAFEAILVRALSRDPAERPSMRELADAFTALLDLPETPVAGPRPVPTDEGPTLVAWPPSRGE